jgi:MerR family transcriptional regulator/heat shock protein HspR
MVRHEQSTRITITVAAQRTGVEPEVVRYCMEVGLVSSRLTQEELAELRRVRRLTELGVNLAGIEIILRMRRRIQGLQIALEEKHRERFNG